MKCAAAVLFLVLVHVLSSETSDITYLIKENCDTYCNPRPCQQLGWSMLPSGDKCVKLFNIPATFDEAEQNCLQYNSHLVSIHNLKDYNEVLCILFDANPVDMTPGWIGLNKEEGSSTYSYTDGTQMDFQRWVNTTASTDEDGRMCVQMNYMIWGHWSPLDCSEKIPFMCEYIVL